MWWTCDSPSCQSHGEKAKIKGSIVGQEDVVEGAQEIDEVGEDVLDGGLAAPMPR